MLPTNFFAYQRRIMRVLLGWAVGNVAAGAAMRRGNAFRRGVGTQCMAWGAVNGAIAGWGTRGAARKAAMHGRGVMDDTAYAKETRGFVRFLSVNAGLDVLYVLGGVALTQRSGERADRRGMGAGIAAQGLFLLVFDAVNARLLQSWTTKPEA